MKAYNTAQTGLLSLSFLFWATASPVTAQDSASIDPTPIQDTKPSGIDVDAIPIVAAYDRARTDLPQDVIEEIVAAARESAGADRDIWFILVSQYSDAQGRMMAGFLTKVVFKPDKRMSRFRSGIWVSVNRPVMGQSLSRMLNDLVTEPSNLQPPMLITSEPKPYVQVSLASEPFGDELQIPGGSLIPFAISNDFKADEVVEVVDFLRAYLAESFAPDVLVPRGDPDKTILSVSREDGQINIRRGYECGGLCGHGDMFSIQRISGAYAVVSRGWWYY